MAQTRTLWVSFTLLLLLVFTVSGTSGDKCLDAKECCLFPSGSYEFNECCILHDCCPRDCHLYETISCCFNRQSYPMGTSLYYLPSQCCLKLVCGAMPSSEPPYLIPTIVPVQIPTQKDCPIPSFEHCVKDNGIVVVDGSIWQKTPCEVCRCENGNITCSVLNNVQCPPPPHPHCREMPSTECCPIYDCPRVCVDSIGVEHNVNEVWGDPMDPCASESCTESGIVKHPLRCPRLPPPPHQHCFPVTKPNQCCPTWECSSSGMCVDGNGVKRDLGETWPHPGGPCMVFQCTNEGPVQKPTRTCPVLPPRPDPLCMAVVEDCCPTWNCTCVDGNGVKRDLGETWPHPGGPCMVFQCTNEGPVQKPTRTCPVLPPRPDPLCMAVVEDCCPTWNCTGCIDYDGVHHVVGESWTHPTNPCITHLCTPNGIRSELPICIPQQPRPNDHCFEDSVECCPTWKCRYCVDNTGERRSVGEDWTDPHNPCLFHTCTEDGIIIDAIMDCPRPPPPPHPDCIWVHEDHQCCGSWQCNFNSGCTDKNGVGHPLGDVWTDQLDPTTHYLCKEDGITSFILNCPLPPPRPSPDCTLTNHQDCCPSWSCPSSGCPNPESVMHHCADVQRNCSTQTDCTPDRRCCPVNGCGNRCLPDMKSGTCPQSTIPLPLCDFPINICQVDQDCPFDLKCCWDCGSKCKQPIPRPY
ncbi:hypothetical protein Pmani_034074 [Petrolisthes manimaculis]|uniref:Kielin/chordin-like protein n=1 Tax=Petrolisthes manimaculis TaxID=1843537 RepID=A0AAE1NN87_9EUCA|nr:hypothetical protein Pmani_034074 [Petrolisthes manimaculis]